MAPNRSEITSMGDVAQQATKTVDGALRSIKSGRGKLAKSGLGTRLETKDNLDAWVKLFKLAGVISRKAAIRELDKNFNLVVTLSNSLAPVYSGSLQRPQIKKSFSASGGYLTADFTAKYPEPYAKWIHDNRWGPTAGRPYQPRTFAKFSSLGVPIGPGFTTRAVGAWNAYRKTNPPKETVAKVSRLFGKTVGVGKFSQTVLNMKVRGTDQGLPT